jgi:hypothetical protein
VADEPADDMAAGHAHDMAAEPAGQPARDMAAGQAHDMAAEPAGQPARDAGNEPPGQQLTRDAGNEPPGQLTEDTVDDLLVPPGGELTSTDLGERADMAAETQTADDVPAAQPAPAALPLFLRKWSPPTPPED